MSAEDRLQRIEARLREKLEASDVQVVDESHKHVGHAGAAGGAGHFRVTVVSPRFAGLSLVQAQRLVYEAVGEMMDSEIHALAITTRAD
jgi:BolA protein